MAPDPDKIRGTLILAGRMEREWIGKIPGSDPVRTAWMPFPVHEYIALLAEAVPEAPGNRFLEIGCGPGSKMLLARDLFGLTVTGIEYSPEYVREAVSLGLHALVADAADFGDYGSYDLIWFHRPFRDPASQAGLEKRVWDDMAPGAVVICANLEDRPPSPPFIPVLDDWEIRRGIWLKSPLA